MTRTWTLLLALFPLTSLHAAEEAARAGGDVSYLRDVLPVFRSECQGCHQPAKDKGDYVMTDFASLLRGGESGEAAIVPGHPDKSYLLEQITPVEGEYEMPPKDGPLPAKKIDLIRRWIAEGARDDSPPSTGPAVDAEHPPVYSQLPVVTAMDYSPDGKWLAVAGYHEVLLHRADGSGIAHRLVGLSERIESVRFSPDGKFLAVAGGNPCRSGELQVWDVGKRELKLSKAVTYDTIYGASWSPDGSAIAVGCAHDKSVRAFDAKSGKQILFMGSHNDWPLDTVWSKGGTHVVSAGRDMTTKLTEVETERFVDNITSITPRALKGGVHGIARHPQEDWILVGGADGEPKIYRAFREVQRRIGDDSNLIRRYPALPGRLFGVSFGPDGKRFAAASALDGRGTMTVCSSEFDAVIPEEIVKIFGKAIQQRNAEEKEQYESWWKEGADELTRIEFETPIYAIAFSPDGKTIAAAGGDGLIRFVDTQNYKVTHTAKSAPLESARSGKIAATKAPDFIRDVNPVMTKLGCNAGTCHGAKDGKNGFKLSLRGYDAVFDIRSLTDDHASRRANVAAPDASLMLLKATGVVPHEGKQVLEADGRYYEILRDWIAGGADVDHDSTRVAGIDVSPLNPVIQEIGGTQRMVVVATYTDGEKRDVTKEAFIESGNTEVATHDETGLLTTIRRGEAPVLARYEGAYASTVLTVMGDRSGFEWRPQPAHNKIDRLVDAKLKRMKILPSDLCTDVEFIRRIFLDLTGLPPRAEDVEKFLADETPSRKKRDALIDRLVGSEPFIDHWTNKWADLLQVNRKFLGPEGASKFRGWIRAQVAGNRPYDEFVHDIITASGSNNENPAASYYKILRTPEDRMENTTHLFLATRFNCNKCHDHPFERWTQDQYYQMAAFFSRTGLKEDPESKNRKIGGTAVEDAKPLYEVVFEKEDGEMVHERTSEVTAPVFPYEADYDIPGDMTRREELAAWITSPENAYFAKSFVNRIWGYLTGTGIIEPLDDIRAGNPPSNPELLEWLTGQFIKSGFNTRHLIRLICQSRTYQLSIATDQWNADDEINFSHAKARRLPAEVLYDAVHAVTGARSKFPGVPPGTRAASLPDAGVKLPDGFLGNLGRPVRESACECERSNDLQLGSVMALVSGPTIADAIGDEDNGIAKLVDRTPDDQELIDRIFLRVLNRHSSQKDVEATLANWSEIEGDHETLVAELAKKEAEWVPIRAARERIRQIAIRKAKSDIKEYQPAHDKERKRLESERKDREATAVKALGDYDATVFEENLGDWENTLTVDRLWTGWTPAVPTKVTASNKVGISVNETGTVFAKGPNGVNSDFLLTIPTDMKKITGIMIEVMPHKDLPGFGPGINSNRNIVLTEVQARYRAKDAKKGEKGEKGKGIAFDKAIADHNQEGFDVMNSINGVVNRPDKGWALAGCDFNAPHRAVFRLEEPLEAEKGAIVTIGMLHRYGGGYTTGNFRVYFTSSGMPLSFGLPTKIAGIIRTPPPSRTEDQEKVLADYFRIEDAARVNLQATLWKEQRPLPPDQKMEKLKSVLAKAGLPVQTDPALARLRQNVEMSIAQTAHRRLTAAQDLTWALINSPAFLFNH